MELTLELLQKMIPGNKNTQHWFDALSKFLPDYEINTPHRIAAFMAQCMHESGNFTAIKENLNYKAETLTKIWPKYFPADVAAEYAHHPEKIANRAYANRMGNGPEESGDGYKYCGRGLIQLTGHDNYQAFADSIETSLDDLPAYIETFEGCVQSACWFWENNNLNALADAGDILHMTKKINGGTLGLEDRTKHYNEIMHLLGG
jgi:putative chitinase